MINFPFCIKIHENRRCYLAITRVLPPLKKHQKFYSLPKRYKQIRRFEQRPFVWNCIKIFLTFSSFCLIYIYIYIYLGVDWIVLLLGCPWGICLETWHINTSSKRRPLAALGRYRLRTNGCNLCPYSFTGVTCAVYSWQGKYSGSPWFSAFCYTKVG